MPVHVDDKTACVTWRSQSLREMLEQKLYSAVTHLTLRGAPCLITKKSKRKNIKRVINWFKTLEQ